MASSTTYDYVDKTGLYYALAKIKSELQAQYIDYDDTNSALGTNINTVQKAIEALDTAIDTINTTSLPGKVDVESGKGLSTNDFSAAYKQQLDDLATTLANYALLSGATFTGAITLPSVAAATNDNTAATTAYVTSAISTALSGITGISFDGPYTDYATMVASVTNPKNGVIYLVSNSGSGQNVNDEYFYKDGKYELFGTTAVDTSNFITNSQMVAVTTKEINNEMVTLGYHLTAIS